MYAHRELHANVEAPPRPHRPLAWNMVHHLSEQPYSGLDLVFSAVEYLREVGNVETLTLADNFVRQLGYVAGGEHV